MMTNKAKSGVGRGSTLAVVLAVFAGLAQAGQPDGHHVSKERASYALGVDLARNFKRQQMEVDMEEFDKGFKDGLSGEKLNVSEVELRDCINTFQVEARQKQALFRGKPAPDINKKKTELFLAANKENPGVTSLASGLQYRVVVAGTGAKPVAADLVQCAYRIALVDGTEILATAAGKPASFKVGEADLRAWREILPLMQVGSKWRVFVPAQFAYGLPGVPGKVGPNEMVVSDLELVAIK